MYHSAFLQAFSPNLKYLVSVGYHHDMQIYVWNWKVSSQQCRHGDE